jgi:hypothetical protein
MKILNRPSGNRIWEDECRGNKGMRGWLWIECQKVHGKMVMNIVPTSIG